MWRRGGWVLFVLCVLLVALGAACGGENNGNPGAFPAQWDPKLGIHVT